MPMPRMHISKVADHNVRPEPADYAHHVFENLIAPDFLCFFGRLRESEVTRAREIEFHAIAARRREQLLRANQTELRRLLWSKIVLATFSACEGEQSHVGMQASRKVSEYGGRL